MSIGNSGRLTPSQRMHYISEVVNFRMGSWSREDLEQFAYDRYYDEVEGEFSHREADLLAEYELIQERRREWSE